MRQPDHRHVAQAQALAIILSRAVQALRTGASAKPASEKAKPKAPKK
jgi:hypothetical protein